MSEDFFVPGHTRVKRTTRTLNMVANGTVVQPAGTIVDRIYARNDTANAVTGGLRVGTTAAGVDIHATIAVGANAVAIGTPLIPAYSSVARNLFVEAVSAWNSAQVDVAIEFTEIT